MYHRQHNIRPSRASIERLEARVQFADTTGVAHMDDAVDSTDGTASAVDLGLAPNSELAGATGPEQPNAYFHLRFTEPMMLLTEVGGMRADLDLEVLRADGSVLATSAQTGTADESILRGVSPGSYYLRIVGDADQPSPFTLRVTSTPRPAREPVTPTPTPTPTRPPGSGPANDGGGASLETARDLGESPTIAFDGVVQDQQVNDYFRFNLPARSNVDATLTGLSSPVELAMLNGNGTPITRTRHPDEVDRQLTRTLAPGVYYLLVFRGNGSASAAALTSAYSLALTTTQLELPPPAGPTGFPPTFTFKGAKAARKAYKFRVEYFDLDGIDPRTVSPDDVLVTGPGGFNQTASILRTKVSRDGTRITAWYSIESPNGPWPTGDDGTGTFQLGLQPGTIADLPGDAVAGAVLGTFTVKSKRR